MDQGELSGQQPPRLDAVLWCAPAFPAAVGLIVGVVFDHHLHLSCWYYLAIMGAATVSALSLRLRRDAGVVIVLAVGVGVGGVLHHRDARWSSRDRLDRLMTPHGRVARVVGVVASTPRQLGRPDLSFARWTFARDRTLFLLDVEMIETPSGMEPASGRLRVTTSVPATGLADNDRLEVFGKLMPLKGPANPGSFDWASYHRRQGVVASMYVDHAECLVPVARSASGKPFGAGTLLGRLRSYVRRLLTGDLVDATDQETSLLEAMVLGHRSRLDRRVNDVFVRAGCIHFLAVSGAHVVVMLWIVQLATRLLTLSPRATAIVMILAVVLYMMIAEPRPPIFRAGTMALLYCLSRLSVRQTAHLNWISLAAILLVVTNPLSVFDVGFQLSFVAVLGVAYVGPHVIGVGTRRVASILLRLADRLLARPHAAMDRALLRRIRDDKAPGRWRISAALLGWLGSAMQASCGAWLAAAPIVAFVFLRVHPWSPVVSVLVFPAVYLLMLLGFAKVGIALLSPSLASGLGGLLVWADGWLIRCVSWFASWPGSVGKVVAPPIWLVALYYVSLGTTAWWLATKRSGSTAPDAGGMAIEAATPPSSVTSPPVCRWLGRVSAVAVLVVMIGSGWWLANRGVRGSLTIHALAVGAGSATVVQLPDGKTLVLDCGTTGAYDVADRVVVPFLDHLGVSRVSSIHVSHANLDHFSGVPTLVDAVECGPVVVNAWFAGDAPAGSAAGHLLDVLDCRGHPVQVIPADRRRWEAGGVLFEQLWPRLGVDERVSANDASSVLRLSYAGRSVLLCGDIEAVAERALMAQGDLAADVLFLPHHGSVELSTGPFLEAVSPSWLVRSSHKPMAQTDNGLLALIGDTPIYNTADVGAVRVTIDHHGVSVTGWLGGG